MCSCLGLSDLPVTRLEELAMIVESIPTGMVCSYSCIGRAMQRPVSGLVVGRMMAHLDDRYPWWRVVRADGTLALARREPILAAKQEQRLVDEGIKLVDGAVPSQYFVDESMLIRLTESESSA